MGHGQMTCVCTKEESQPTDSGETCDSRFDDVVLPFHSSEAVTLVFADGGATRSMNPAAV